MPQSLGERPCVQCGALTAMRVVDADNQPSTAVPMCTRCAWGEAEADENIDHPKPMPEREVFDFVTCPECKTPKSLPLLADRPEGTVVGARTGAMARCTNCHADVWYGLPPV